MHAAVRHASHTCIGSWVGRDVVRYVPAHLTCWHRVMPANQKRCRAPTLSTPGSTYDAAARGRDGLCTLLTCLLCLVCSSRGHRVPLAEVSNVVLLVLMVAATYTHVVLKDGQFLAPAVLAVLLTVRLLTPPPVVAPKQGRGVPNPHSGISRLQLLNLTCGYVGTWVRGCVGAWVRALDAAEACSGGVASLIVMGFPGGIPTRSGTSQTPGKTRSR
mgnify:CR=1 FL=1|jgi:hypothetical protein